MLTTLRRIADTPGKLALRIGVNRGAVFAGDVGPSYRRTYTTMGDTVNLAARLMAKAEPGQVLASTTVVDRAGARFQTEPAGPFDMKGVRDPVPAFAIGATRRRLDVASTTLPLVGRDAEITAFSADLEAVRAGEGRVIELVGEPGIGKSRLTNELRELGADLPGITVTCEAYDATTPYAPFWWLLHDLLLLTQDASPEMVEGKLRQVVAELSPELEPLAPAARHAARPRSPRDQRDREPRAGVPSHPRARGDRVVPRSHPAQPGAARARGRPLDRRGVTRGARPRDPRPAPTPGTVVHDAARHRARLHRPGAGPRSHAPPGTTHARRVPRGAARRDRGLTHGRARGGCAGRARRRQPAVPRRAAERGGPGRRRRRASRLRRRGRDRADRPAASGPASAPAGGVRARPRVLAGRPHRDPGSRPRATRCRGMGGPLGLPHLRRPGRAPVQARAPTRHGLRGAAVPSAQGPPRTRRCRARGVARRPRRLGSRAPLDALLLRAPVRRRVALRAHRGHARECQVREPRGRRAARARAGRGPTRRRRAFARGSGRLGDVG